MPPQTLRVNDKIKRLENGAASPDGLTVKFDIVTTDDRIYPFWMSGNDLENFVAYVIGLSQLAAGSSGKMHAPEEREVRQANPIEGVALSLIPGRVETEGFLTVHLGTFALTFALSANILQDLHNRLGKMLHPIAPQKPN